MKLGAGQREQVWGSYSAFAEVNFCVAKRKERASKLSCEILIENFDGVFGTWFSASQLSLFACIMMRVRS